MQILAEQALAGGDLRGLGHFAQLRLRVPVLRAALMLVPRHAAHEANAPLTVGALQLRDAGTAEQSHVAAAAGTKDDGGVGGQLLQAQEALISLVIALAQPALHLGRTEWSSALVGAAAEGRQRAGIDLAAQVSGSTFSAQVVSTCVCLLRLEALIARH